MVRINLILFLLFYINTSLFSQKTEANFDEDIIKLNNLGKQIIGNETNEGKYKANTSYKGVLKDLINKKQSFDFDFDSLKTISILKANNLKIYNWALPLTDGTFEYFAFLQIRKSKEELSKRMEKITKIYKRKRTYNERGRYKRYWFKSCGFWKLF